MFKNSFFVKVSHNTHKIKKTQAEIIIKLSGLEFDSLWRTAKSQTARGGNRKYDPKIISETFVPA